MTQSKDDTITINIDDYTTDTIDLGNIDGLTVGGSTLSWSGDNMSDITFDSSIDDGTFTIDINDSGTIDLSNLDINHPNWGYINTSIDPDEVEHMCKEYPALTKVWQNFKSVYDMVKQDYEGKKQAGELDDDIPF